MINGHWIRWISGGGLDNAFMNFFFLSVNFGGLETFRFH